jgi:hypothetical protein
MPSIDIFNVVSIGEGWVSMRREVVARGLGYGDVGVSVSISKSSQHCQLGQLAAASPVRSSPVQSCVVVAVLGWSSAP